MSSAKNTLVASFVFFLALPMGDRAWMRMVKLIRSGDDLNSPSMMKAIEQAFDQVLNRPPLMENDGPIVEDVLTAFHELVRHGLWSRRGDATMWHTEGLIDQLLGDAPEHLAEIIMEVVDREDARRANAKAQSKAAAGV